MVTIALGTNSGKRPAVLLGGWLRERWARPWIIVAFARWANGEKFTSSMGLESSQAIQRICFGEDHGTRPILY